LTVCTVKFNYARQILHTVASLQFMVLNCKTCSLLCTYDW